TDSCAFTITVTRPPQILLTRFVAFGDSITLGEDGTNDVSPNMLGSNLFYPQVVLAGFEYPTVLQLELQTRYTGQFSFITVSNAGFRGEAAGDPTTLMRFSSAVLNTDRQVVLIMEGANDLVSGVAAEPAAISNLQTMIVRAKAAAIRPYLATIPP